MLKLIDYKSQNLRCSLPEAKRLKDGSKWYHRMPIWYQFAGKLDDLLIELDPVYTPIGITSEVLSPEFTQYKIPSRVQKVEILQQIYWDTALFLHGNRNRALITEYPSPFETSLIDLNLYQRLQWKERSLFTDPKGDPIDWNLLMNVSMTFIPLIRIKHVHIMEGKASLQMELVSAIITSILPLK